MLMIDKITKHWLHGLISALVLGVSNAVLNYVGIATLDNLGIKVPQMDWKQGLVLVFVGGAVGVFAYLKQFPLPPEEAEEEARKVIENAEK
jgi:hypothetical protein